MVVVVDEKKKKKKAAAKMEESVNSLASSGEPPTASGRRFSNMSNLAQSLPSTARSSNAGLQPQKQRRSGSHRHSADSELASASAAARVRRTRSALETTANALEESAASGASLGVQKLKLRHGRRGRRQRSEEGEDGQAEKSGEDLVAGDCDSQDSEDGGEKNIYFK